MKKTYQGMKDKSKGKFGVLGERELLVEVSLPMVEAWEELQAQVEGSAALPNPQAAQRGRASAKERASRLRPQNPQRLRDDRVRDGESGAGKNLPAIGTDQSERGAQPGSFPPSSAWPRNVKRWRAGDHALRWTVTGLLEAEKKFRRVKGTGNGKPCRGNWIRHSL